MFIVYINHNLIDVSPRGLRAETAVAGTWVVDQPVAAMALVMPDEDQVDQQ